MHHHNISTILKPSQAWEPNFRTILLFFFFYKTAVSIHKHYLVSSSSLCPASPAPELEASPSRHSPFSYSSIAFHFVLGKSKSKKHAKHIWCSVDQMFNLRTFSHLVGKLTNNLLKRIVPSNRVLIRVLHLHINTFSSLSTLSSTFYVQKEFYRHSALKTNSTLSIRSFNITTAK